MGGRAARGPGRTCLLPYSGTFETWGRNHNTLRSASTVRPGDVVTPGRTRGGAAAGRPVTPVFPVHPTAFHAARPRWGASGPSPIRRQLQAGRLSAHRRAPAAPAASRSTPGCSNCRALTRLREDHVRVRTAAINQLARRAGRRHWPGPRRPVLLAGLARSRWQFLTDYPTPRDGCATSGRPGWRLSCAATATGAASQRQNYCAGYARHPSPPRASARGHPQPHHPCPGAAAQPPRHTDQTPAHRTAGSGTDQRRSSPDQLVTPRQARSEAAFAALAGAAPSRLIRANQPPPPQPRRRPPTQPALHTSCSPAAAPIPRPARLHHPPTRRRQNRPRNQTLPQEDHRPPDLPAAPTTPIGRQISPRNHLTRHSSVIGASAPFRCATPSGLPG